MNAMCKLGSNNDFLIALIGVAGTLIGTVLGWILSSISYKIGKTVISATIMPTMEVPDISQKSVPKTEYFFDCVATNSRQIPIMLKAFHIELKKSLFSQPINLAVYEPDPQPINAIIVATIALQPQIIPPRSLHSFRFKVDYHEPDIQWSQVQLIAYDERHKKHKFLLYNGFKLKNEFKKLGLR